MYAKRSSYDSNKKDNIKKTKKIIMVKGAATEHSRKVRETSTTHL